MDGQTGRQPLRERGTALHVELERANELVKKLADSRGEWPNEARKVYEQYVVGLVPCQLPDRKYWDCDDPNCRKLAVIEDFTSGSLYCADYFEHMVMEGGHATYE